MTRIYAEIAEALKAEDWVLTNGSSQAKENLYLPAAKFNQILGKYKGGGLGYGLPASLGAALAHKGSGKFCVNIQPDGDLLFTVSAIWTAVHHQIPLLSIVCSNRSYFNDEEHQERVALAAQAPGGKQNHRHPHRRSQRRLRRHGAHLRLLGRRPDHRAEGFDQDLARSGEGGERGQAGVGGCGLPDALTVHAI